MVDGVELVSNIITRYTIFEELYLRPTIVWENADDLKGQLTQAIIKLYIAVLKYLSRARRYLGRGTAGIGDECARLTDAARMLDSSVAIGLTTAINTTSGAETILQRPARYEDPLTHRSDSDEPAHVIPSLGQPLLPVPHCKMCNILFYLWISLADTSLAVGLWRSLATSDEGKGFTDAAYVIAVGGLGSHLPYPESSRVKMSTEQEVVSTMRMLVASVDWIFAQLLITFVALVTVYNHENLAPHTSFLAPHATTISNVHLSQQASIVENLRKHSLDPRA
jgi:hypothetical protein